MEEELKSCVNTPQEKVKPKSELLKTRLQHIVEDCFSIESEVMGVKNSLLGIEQEKDCESGDEPGPPDSLFDAINFYLNDVNDSLNATKQILLQVRGEGGL